MDGPTAVLLGFAVVLTSGVLSLDVLTNPRVAAAALYSLVIFYCWLFPGAAPVLGAAILCSLLALGDVFLATSSAEDHVGGINKIISIGVVWVSAALVLFVKSSAKQVEESGRRLAAEAAKFETALENAPNAVLIVDPRGVIVLANAQAETLFGYSRTELTHVDLLVPDSVRASHPQMLSKFFGEPKARTMGAARDLTARRKDGTEVDVEIGLSPIETTEGTRVIASVVDISARKLAAALVQEQHRLEAERLTRELQLAAKIQTSILPHPPFASGIDIAARMIPAATVGGDYYDVFPAQDGCWLAIGDVSGHGLDAGLVSLMVQSATSAILHSTPDVALPHAVAGINATLYDNMRRLARSEYVTFSILRYRNNGAVAYCGAHQDILVWRAATKTVERHPTQGIWLALRSSLETETQTLQLSDGDLMVLITDGLIESRNEAGELWGIEAAMTLLAVRGHLPTVEIVDALVEQSLEWALQPEDDVTVVVLRHRV